MVSASEHGESRKAKRMASVIKSVRVALIAISVYALAWIVGYLSVMGWDRQFVSAYFVYGWTGGGELPGLINLFAILVAVMVSSFLYWMALRRGR